ncbi:5'-3' exoribonuclease 2 [Sarcoptes scabiei]|uniref:5'-3' exoribonuclease n=1 Tax=Sarcoptes scabiei TaxID=52283 RepID=A0A132A7L8_SARSC|nr:5'-3' exoribonuclease 2 [Sarcoptes scabiei]KPM06934.1 5'-3' exoribonuclease 2-like protein [Sarcoptes scabiei]
MGVPAFFRWLSRKYPSIIVHCDEGVKGQYHFDNLYLDMNGIIHPCSHPENKPPPANEEEMFLAIFEYVENIMKIVRPKKLLYMAIDGVAPRAKMNQQRSRRFRAAQESYEKLIQIEEVKENLRQKGLAVPEKSESAHFDSNVITPGTNFMINLSDALRSWVNRRLSDDFDDTYEIWPKDLVVILSDSSVPGEGEHKIMDYIRRQKADKEYDPNLSHCLYGADADLIMLGLATHEPNFTILREEFKPNQPRPCDLCGQLGHELKDCVGEAKPAEELAIVADTSFIYIRLNVLREYLHRECNLNTRVQLNFERFIDDYVFMCFFVGNDFLPHLPSLEIRENAIDRLIKIYKFVMESYPDPNDIYLTKNGFVNKNRAELVLKELGEVEDEIFKQRRQNDLNFKERNKRRKLMQAETELRWMKPELVSKDEKPEVFTNAKEEALKVRMAFKDHYEPHSTSSNKNTRLEKMLVKSNTSNDHDRAKSKLNDENSNGSQPSKKRKLGESDSDSDDEVDEVKLYNDGWKERYYSQKFRSKSMTSISKQVADEYFKGLCWVLLYYYQGCPDWKWFFPFHYACFASDFRNLDEVDVRFDSKAKPFQPLEQLMSVFPAASSKNLPSTWRRLMIDTSSPIIDFYPSTFKIDLNGKKASWMGVALLPFIDEDRLFESLAKVYDDLNDEEKFRNRHGSHLMFISPRNPILSEQIRSIIEDSTINDKQIKSKIIFGRLKKSSIYSDQYKQTHCCEFYDPTYQEGFIFPAQMLKNAKIPNAVLKPLDLDKFERYRPIIGMNPRQNQASLDVAGHRIIQRSIQKDFQNRDNYHNQYGYQNYRHQNVNYTSYPNYSNNHYDRNNYQQQNRYNNNYHQRQQEISNQTPDRNRQQMKYSSNYGQYNSYHDSMRSNPPQPYYSNYQGNVGPSSYYSRPSHQSSSSYSSQNNQHSFQQQQQYRRDSQGSNISSYYTANYPCEKGSNDHHQRSHQ